MRRQAKTAAQTAMLLTWLYVFIYYVYEGFAYFALLVCGTHIFYNLNSFYFQTLSA